MDEITARRARLVEIDRELAGLRAQYDLAMSAFKFDEANALQPRIAELEEERLAVVAVLPKQIPPPEPGGVPVLARPRRARRRRMG